MFITNIHASFHLWQKENLLIYQNVSKYYEHSCRYQIGLETSMKGSNQKIDLNRGGSCIDSSILDKNKSIKESPQ